jgi:transcriptional regulator with XRE-family HTH domain
MIKFANRFTKLINEKNVKHKDIHQATLINIGSISKLRNGKISPSPEILKILSTYFDVDISYLLGESENKRSKDILPTCYVEVCLDAINKHIKPETLKQFIDLVCQEKTQY